MITREDTKQIREQVRNTIAAGILTALVAGVGLAFFYAVSATLDRDTLHVLFASALLLLTALIIITIATLIAYTRAHRKGFEAGIKSRAAAARPQPDRRSTPSVPAPATVALTVPANDAVRFVGRQQSVREV